MCVSTGYLTENSKDSQYLNDTLPHPGGPHRIMLGISPFCKSSENMVRGPRICLWPTKFSNDVGLICSASGTCSFPRNFLHSFSVCK